MTLAASSHPESAAASETGTAPPPRLLDVLRARMRRLGLSLRTEKACVGWVRRFACVTSATRARWARAKSRRFSPCWRRAIGCRLWRRIYTARVCGWWSRPAQWRDALKRIACAGRGGGRKPTGDALQGRVQASRGVGRPPRDHRASRQGRQGPAHDAAGRGHRCAARTPASCCVAGPIDCRMRGN